MGIKWAGRLSLPSAVGVQAGVDPGDGLTLPASLLDNGDGTFAVSAAVHYHLSGDYPFTVTVTDPSGIQAQLHDFAHVTRGPNETYVSQAYVDLLGRTPDRDGLAFWVTSLNTGTPRPAVADFLTHSAEYYATNVIGPAYLQFLGRAADDAGLAFWVAQMQAGMTDQQVQAAFVGSAEFFANAGGSDALWVDARDKSCQFIDGRLKRIPPDVGTC